MAGIEEGLELQWIISGKKEYINGGQSIKWGFPDGSDGKVPASNEGDLGLISGLGRYPGEGNGNPLQYSCLENSMDGGSW